MKRKQVATEKEKRIWEREIEKKEEQKRKARKAAEQETEKEEKEAQVAVISPKTKRENDTDTAINTNKCCICLGTYLKDLNIDGQWLECCCERWTHKDCVDSEDIDNSCNDAKN